MSTPPAYPATRLLQFHCLVIKFYQIPLPLFNFYQIALPLFNFYQIALPLFDFYQIPLPLFDFSQIQANFTHNCTGCSQLIGLDSRDVSYKVIIMITRDFLYVLLQY